MHDSPKAKKLKLTVDRANSMAHITGNYGEMQDHVINCNGNSGKCTHDNMIASTNYDGEMEQLDDSSTTSTIDLKSSSDSLLDSNLLDSDSSYKTSISLAEMDVDSMETGESSNKMSRKDIDKR